MRIYLDDIRRAPIGWQLVSTADECIRALERGDVTELSLDHDLSYEHYDNGYSGPIDRSNYREKTGFAVVEWMIKNGVWPDLIILHTMNPVGRINMQVAIERHAPDHVRCEVRVGFSG